MRIWGLCFAYTNKTRDCFLVFVLFLFKIFKILFCSMQQGKMFFFIGSFMALVQGKEKLLLYKVCPVYIHPFLFISGIIYVALM